MTKRLFTGDRMPKKWRNWKETTRVNNNLRVAIDSIFIHYTHMFLRVYRFLSGESKDLPSSPSFVQSLIAKIIDNIQIIIQDIHVSFQESSQNVRKNRMLHISTGSYSPLGSFFRRRNISVSIVRRVHRFFMDRAFRPG